MIDRSIDVKLSLAEIEVSETEAFDEENFEAILTSATRIRGKNHESATSNIRKVQGKQKKYFDPLLLRNNKRKVFIGMD